MGGISVLFIPLHTEASGGQIGAICGVRDYIKQQAVEHDVSPTVAIAVAEAESGMKSDAYNDEWHRDCQGSYGLFQIACVHSKDGNYKKFFDPYVNVDMAFRVHEKQGWDAWGVCGDEVKCK